RILIRCTGFEQIDLSHFQDTMLVLACRRVENFRAGESAQQSPTAVPQGVLSAEAEKVVGGTESGADVGQIDHVHFEMLGNSDFLSIDPGRGGVLRFPSPGQSVYGDTVLDFLRPLNYAQLYPVAHIGPEGLQKGIAMRCRGAKDISQIAGA